MIDADLLPCPGCEGTTDLHVEDMSGAGGVICTNCGMSGPTAEGRKNIIAAWNALPRSRPSGLALEWRAGGLKDNLYRLVIGDMASLGYVTRLDSGRWFAMRGHIGWGFGGLSSTAVEIKSDASDGGYDTEEAAQAAVERAVRSALGLEDGWRPTHKHRKSGGLYRVVCEAEIEADLTLAVVYESEAGRLWIRPKAEFDDGRFLPLPNTEGNDG